MTKRTIVTLMVVLAAFAVAGPAQALGVPLLHVTSSHVPAGKPVPSGSYAVYTLAVSNPGDAYTEGPITAEFTVPAGLEITQASGPKVFGFPSWNCSIPDSQTALCEDPFFNEIGPGEEACEEFGTTCHISIAVKAEPNAPPGTLHPSATVCGGSVTVCPAVAAIAPDDPIEVGPPAAFAIKSFDGTVLQEDGDPATQAGSHPYTAATEFFIPTVVDPNGAEPPVQDIKDVSVKLPPGLVGNPRALPTCSEAQLFGEDGNSQCPPESQVGNVVVWGSTASPGFTGPTKTALYNMQVAHGTPAVLAFDISQTLVQVYVKVRTGDDYGVTVISKNAPQALFVEGVTFSVWGIPGDASHDNERACPGHPATSPEYGCHGSAPKPFLTLPTSCEGPGLNNSVETFIDVTSWQNGEATSSFLSHDNTLPTPNPIGITGCNSVDFSPTLQARPTTNIADSPSGLDVDLHVPQHEACDAGPPVSCENAEANLRDTTVTLPEGMTINPSGANGLGACSEAQFGFTSKEGDVIHTTPDPATCPDQARLGTVAVETPVFDHPLKGAAYIAAPYANPFGSLLALYITVDDPQTGVVVKLAGEVHADPTTGQLTTTVLHNPQLPFEDFKLHFFGGAGGALRTPATCGTYSTTSSLTPWSAPDSGPPATPSDPWAISQAPGGGACPTSAGARPHSPSFDAGSVTPIAGTYSPFVESLRREDGSQEFSKIVLTLPPGLTGKLAGVSACSDGALVAAASKSGRAEEASPSCPAASRIGTVDVAAGAGPAPYNAQGIAYLTGPYKGAPLSVAIVTPATAGPFDLGTVIVRAAMYIDPNNGQAKAVSDTIPSILQGIPLDLRSMYLHLDRSQFIRNGTSCDPKQITTSVLSTLGQTASLAERFQLGECGGLAFKPKLGIRLIGGTKRGSHPALTATLTMPEGGANIAKAAVALPHSEFLDQAHIGTVCTRVQFAANECPAASVYGRATATSPLVDYAVSGPVYLRSSSNKLPDLVMALHGPPSQPVEIDAVARIDSIKGGIRSTFEGVPDLPLTKVVLEMEGGKKGLLQNSTNICKGVHKVTAEFDGQNGKAADLAPILKNGKCGKAKRSKGRAARHRAMR